MKFLETGVDLHELARVDHGPARRRLPTGNVAAAACGPLITD
ncbi:MAG: hypothetical protein ABSH20_28655 [Tepidisphaeraceae bacterium]